MSIYGVKHDSDTLVLVASNKHNAIQFILNSVC